MKRIIAAFLLVAMGFLSSCDEDIPTLNGRGGDNNKPTTSNGND